MPACEKFLCFLETIGGLLAGFIVLYLISRVLIILLISIME